MQRSTFCAWVFALLVGLAGNAPGWAQTAQPWRFDAPGRVVVVGDVHGAYEALTTLLRESGVIDEHGQWSGGNTQLVSLGDLVDRGARSRAVLDLLMRLQTEAEAAGGRVHVVLGDHEVMNLTGDLRYVTPEEYASYEDLESEETRAAAREAFITERTAAGADSAGAEAEFAERYPPGYFGHRVAFSRAGPYGAWLAGLPTVLVVGETAFIHAGVPPSVAEFGGDGINRSVSDSLNGYLELWRDLSVRFALPPEVDERGPALVSLGEPEAAAQLASFDETLPFSPVGPLWYRETARCHPLTQFDTVRAGLERLGARQVVVGHTPTRDGRVQTRLDGLVVMADTGMLTSYYEGRPAALIITGDSNAVRYAGATATEAAETQIRRVGERPGGMSDDELEAFLRSAAIVKKEEVGTGVTRPLRVTLEQDGISVRALFKTVSTPITGSGSARRQRIEISDRYEHEIAAYRLDRLLDLELVPVTVEREIDGKKGALQFWVNGLVSLLEKNEQGIKASGDCPINPQYNLMYIFDSLILNTDRTQQNVTFTEEDWMLVLIDHSRAFRISRKLPEEFLKFPIEIGPEMAARLARLDQAMLTEALSAYLQRDQIRAVLARRDDLLKAYGSRR